MNTLLEKANAVFPILNISTALIAAFNDRPFQDIRSCGKDVKLVLWSSVETAEHWIKIQHTAVGFRVFIGSSSGSYLPLHQESQQEQRRNFRLFRLLQEEGYSTSFEPGQAELRAETICATAEEAFKAANTLALILTEKLGMELALENLISVRQNALEVTDSNLDMFFADTNTSGAIIFSELTQCIRCRRNWPESIHITKAYPQMRFGFVFLNKSRAAFKRKIFSEQRPDIIPTGIVAPTAFLIRNGQVQEYIGTRLDEPLPHREQVEAAIHRVFGLEV